MSPANVQPYKGALGPSWKVVNVTETTAADSTGRFTAGKQVTYQLDSGLSGTVFLPDAQFNEDAVRAAINQAAAQLHAVGNLTSG